MPVRIVEGQLPYTGGTGIEIDTNKVISLLLREENNLILVNDDNEIYTDLQLASGLTPQSDFPVGVTTGKVLEADGRPQSGLMLNWKTTSGDYARWIYCADGEIYFDGGNGVWRKVYYSSEVDALLLQLKNYVDLNFQPKLIAGAGITIDANNVISAQGAGTGDVSGPNGAVNGHLAVFDGATGKLIKDGGAIPEGVPAVGSNGQVLTVVSGVAAWANATGGSDIEYVTQAEYNALLPGALTDGKHYFIYSTDGGGGWQPGVNTIAYYPLIADTNDQLNTYNLTNSNITFGELGGVICANFNGSSSKANGNFHSYGRGDLTASVWGYPTSNNQGVWWAINVTTLVMNSKNGYVEGTSAPTPLNQWTNIVFTITGGKLKIYSNGTLYLDTSYSNNVSGDLSLGAANTDYYLSGGISNLIFENVAWTAQEVLDYFDLTKANYGIS